MPINEDRIAKLREFGLSEYAARAYLALLDLGFTEARDVSTLSKVPTSKIYHILEQLHDKGLVIILPEFPKKYAPVPFSEYLDKLKRDHEDAARAIERDREDLASLFSVMGDVAALDRGSFTVVRGRRNVISKLSELSASATSRLLIMGSPGLARMLADFPEDLKRAQGRGVETRLLMPVAREDVDDVASLEALGSVRVRDLSEWPETSHVAIGVSDDAQAIIVHFSPDDGNSYQGKDVAIFADHQAMVATVRALLEPHWMRARTIAERRAELDGTGPVEFTRFYHTQGQAYGAIRAALESDVNEFRYVNTMPAQPKSDVGSELESRLASIGARARVMLNLTDADTARSYLDMLESGFAGDIRHVDASAFARFWLIDEREAFYSLTRPRAISAWEGGGSPDEAADLVIHTSNAGTIESLGVDFEAMWSGATPLRRRLKDLESGAAAKGGATEFLGVQSEALAASRKLVDAAEREMLVLCTPEGLAMFSEGPHARAALDRGVKVRILTNVTPAQRDLALRVAERAEVRHVPAMSIIGNSIDGQQTLVLLPKRDGSTSRIVDPLGELSFQERSVIAVRSADPVYVTAFDGFFEGQWEVAMPLEERLHQLDAGGDPRSARLVPHEPPKGSAKQA